MSFGGVAIADEWDSLNTFFSDNYQVKANKTGANINDTSNNAEGRFSDGLIGALKYNITNLGKDYQVQVGNPVGSLLIAPTKNTTTTKNHVLVSPNYNFGTNLGTSTPAEEGGRLYEIDLRIKPENNANASDEWAAIVFGYSNNPSGCFVNNSNGVGIYIRSNGNYEIFNGSSSVKRGHITLDNGWADLIIQYSVPDFDGGTSTIKLYNADTELVTINKQLSGNGIVFNCNTNSSGANRNQFADFIIKSSANYNYDISNADVFALDKNWTTNGLDKRDVVFQSARDGATEAEHTGSITMGANTTIDVASGLTLLQSGGITGQYTLTKTGEGTLQINAAQNAVDVESLVISSGRLDMKEYFKGDLEINNGATFSPGNSIGMLNQTGDYTLDEGATLWLEVGKDGNSIYTDILNVTGDTIFEDGSIIKIALDSNYDNAFEDGEQVDIQLPTGIKGGDGNDLDMDNLVFQSSMFNLVGYDAGTGYLSVVYSAPTAGVPEPSTWTLLILGAAGLLYCRKRKN